jgi:hypothetical protein
MSIKESTSKKKYSNDYYTDKKKKRRNPNRKPSNKIFDIIGDIIKIPYKIRGGKD